jgi:hypothetical protein
MQESKLNKFFDSIKSVFAEAEKEDEQENATFADIKTMDGTILRVSDIEVGATVDQVDGEGVTPAEDGEYQLEDESVLIVANGLITEIIEAPEAEEVIEIEIEAGADKDKVEAKMMAVLLQDGTEVEVQTQVEGEITEGDIIAGAEDGEYILEDGRVIVVASEAIAEIKPVEMEAEPTVEEQEITGVVNNLKELINQVKDLKSQFEALKEENAKIKSNFAAASRVASLDQEVKFEAAKPRKSSPLRNAVGM